MNKTVKIALTAPLLDHEGPVREIILREPTFDEYMTHGEPYEVAASADGARFAVQNADTVKTYLELCLLQPSDPALLDKCGIAIARKVRSAILGFFQDGDEEGEASKTSPTSSSSAATTTSTSAPSVG